MNKITKGFTLLEVVVVMAVVALLASVAWPLFSRARLDARRTTSASNLRQCWLALRMYCDDHEGDEAMPKGEVAAQVLKNAPTCDPNDTWRQSCDEVFGPPLVGSYAYLRSGRHLDDQEWRRYVGKGKNRTLLASIYYASVVPSPFHGEDNYDECDSLQENCFLPDRVLRLHLDGSVRFARQSHGYTGGSTNGASYMAWWLVFADLDLDEPQVTSPRPEIDP